MHRRRRPHRRRGRVIVACFASHVHRVQQVIDAAERARPARSRSSAARWSATWASRRDLGYLRIPPGLMVDMKDVEHLPDDQVVLVSTGSQGEPLSALSRMANRSHHQIRIEARGHRRSSRRRSSPATRTPSTASSTGCPAGAPASCTRASRRCTSPATRRPASCSTCSTPPGRPTSCRCTASGATCARTPSWPGSPASRDERIVLAEDGVVVDLVDGKAEIVGAVPVRLRLRRRPRGRRRRRVDAQGPPHPRRRGLHLRHVAVDSVTGKIAGGPEISARGFSDDRRGVRPGRARSSRPSSTGPPARASPTRTRSPQSVRRVGRPLGQRHLPPPPDDHPGRRRGLSRAPSAGPRGPAPLTSWPGAAARQR